MHRAYSTYLTITYVAIKFSFPSHLSILSSTYQIPNLANSKIMSSTMTRNVGEDAFQFINITDVFKPQDPAARKIIRKQAMVQAAAARRQKTNHRKQQNLLQCRLSAECQQNSNLLEPTLDPKSSENVCERTDKAMTNDTQDDLSLYSHVDFEGFNSCLELSRPRSIPTGLTSVGYESMRIQFDFDILELSALTGFHTGRATTHALLGNPARLVEILQCRQWSYISFLPSRYGHVACLDDAICCVAARVRHCLSFPRDLPNTRVMMLYSKALVSLQTALEDPQYCLQPEVLCATEILSIYEVSELYHILLLAAIDPDDTVAGS